jgi:hypothetical protein
MSQKEIQRAVDVAKKVAVQNEILAYDVRVISAASKVPENDLIGQLKSEGYSVVDYAVPGMEVFSKTETDRIVSNIRRAASFGRLRRQI